MQAKYCVEMVDTTDNNPFQRLPKDIGARVRFGLHTYT